MGVFPGEAIPETSNRLAAQGLSQWILSIAGRLEATRMQLRRKAGQAARAPAIPAQGGPWERTRILDRAGRKASPGPETRHKGV